MLNQTIERLIKCTELEYKGSGYTVIRQSHLNWVIGYLTAIQDKLNAQLKEKA